MKTQTERIIKGDYSVLIKHYKYPSEEIDIPEPPYREGYYYKQVGEDFKSNVWSANKIDYTVGNIVNGRKKGICIHNDPMKPYITKGICIELMPIGKTKIERDEAIFNIQREAQVYGDFKVTRVVPYFDSSESRAEIKYRIPHKEEIK